MMDNDLKLVKVLKQKIKALKFKFDYRDIKVMDEIEGNNRIYELLQETEPIMVARAGATEMRCISEYLEKKGFSNKIRREILELSGVFPIDDLNLKKFCEYYIECIDEADLISLWGVGAESKIIHKYCRDSEFTKLAALEPYYHELPWSLALVDKKVLIIHPFVESIKKQLGRRIWLWDNKNVLPEFAQIEYVKAIQSFAGGITEFDDWFDALEHMKIQINHSDFDVAIIGAGAYGLPLAAHCKEIGKKAIQMSGATQILFGIKGKRWDEHPIISKYYNEYWIRPNETETPPQIQKVEGGSYW